MSDNVGVYLRISLDRDGKSTSTERQLEDCQRICAAKGWTVGEVYEDKDLSAFDPKVERPEFERMMSDVKAGRLNAVVIWKIDRLSRSLIGFASTLQTLMENKCELVSVNDPVDTSTATGRAMLHIIAVFAQLESETISMRTSSAWARNAKQGKPHPGGRRAFGYNRDGSVNEPEAECIREAASRIIEGESMWAICQDFSKRGIKTTAGNNWTTAGMSQMFRKTRIAGYRVHEGKRYEGEWEAIVDLDTYAAVQEQLKHNKKMTIRREGRNLLTGLLICGDCGAKMARRIQKRKGHEYSRYYCPPNPAGTTCGVLSAAQVHVDDLVSAKLLAHYSTMDSSSLAVERDQERISTLTRLVADDEESLAQITKERFIERSMTDEDYQTVRIALAERIANSKSELKMLEQDNFDPEAIPTDIDSLEDWWANAETNSKRDLASRVITRITVGKAQKGRNTFDPERIKISWR
jgi:site-specific DNA recombinase